MHVERRDRLGPDQSPVVVVQLGDDRQHARDADAVRPHRHGDELAVLVEHFQSQRFGVFAAELEHMADLHAARELDRAGTVGCRIARVHFGDLDSTVVREVAPGDKPEHVVAFFVRAGDPAGTVGDTRVDEIADARARVFPQHRSELRPRSDVPLHEPGARQEVLGCRLLHLTGGESHFGALEVDLTVSWQSDHDDLPPAVEVLDGEDDVLERVSSRPRTPIRARMFLVRQIHQGLDRRGVRGVEDFGGRQLLIGAGRGRERREGLHVGCVATGGTHEGVLADRCRVQELLTAGAAHRSGIRLHDHILEAEAREDALVGVALRHVARVEPLVGVVERVRILHGEFAPAQQAGTGSRLVTVLVLDLVDRQRQVLVARVEVFHQQGEDLFVGRGEKVVPALAVLEPENAVAVLLPPAGGLVGVTRKERGEMHFVRAGGLHLFADDLLDLALDPKSQRQPREDARRLPADIPRAHEQPVAGHFGVGRVFTKGAEEVVRQACRHRSMLEGDDRTIARLPVRPPDAGAPSPRPPR